MKITTSNELLSMSSIRAGDVFRIKSNNALCMKTIQFTDGKVIHGAVTLSGTVVDYEIYKFEEIERVAAEVRLL